MLDMSLFSRFTISCCEFELLMPRPRISPLPAPLPKGGCGNLLVPLMAAIGLGRPVFEPFGLQSPLVGGTMSEDFESDLELSEPFEEVFAEFFSLTRGSEFFVRLKVEFLLSPLISSLFSERAGLFSFLSSLLDFVCSFFSCAAINLDCFVLTLPLPEVTLTVGGFICDMWPSLRLSEESERSERAEEKPEDDEVRFDCACILVDAALTAFCCCCFSLLNNFSLSSIECFCCGCAAGATLAAAGIPLGGGMPLGWVGLDVGGRKLRRREGVWSEEELMQRFFSTEVNF